MRTTEIFVEHVIIGFLVLVSIVLPFADRLLCDAGELAARVPDGFEASVALAVLAVLVAAAYLLGIVADRCIDTLLGDLEKHNRLDRLRDPATLRASALGLHREDPFPEDLYRVALLGSAEATAYAEYLRARVRLTRAVATLTPPLGISVFLYLLREQRDEWWWRWALPAVGALYALGLITKSWPIGYKPPTTSASAAKLDRHWARLDPAPRDDKWQDKVDRFKRRARLICLDSALWPLFVLMVCWVVIAIRKGPGLVWIPLVAAALSLLAGCCWWRVSTTFGRFVRDHWLERNGAALLAVPHTGGVEGASGVARRAGDLLIVSDDSPGRYFGVTLHRDEGPLILIAPERAWCRDLPADVPGTPRLALDLEGIDVLADGRVVALSERLRCLIGADGVVAQYDDPLGEFAEKGLEGLAVRSMDTEVSRVAVLWEGGYLDPSELPEELREVLGGRHLKPVILVHDLAPQAQAVKVRMGDAKNTISLDLAALPEIDPAVPLLRFRAPDLVWHRLSNDGEPEWGFIVLLNSETSAHVNPVGEKKKHGPRWLQRFDMRGRPRGKQIDLDEAIAKALEGAAVASDVLVDANWEGLAWFEPGKSVVLVHDEPKTKLDHPAAIVLPLPPDW